jgi:hypothetical protein
MTEGARDVSRHFFFAARELAWHTGTLQERLADAYADHLLPVVASELPSELQSVFREVEERMTAAVDDTSDDDDGDDPFRAAAQQLSDDEARALIERIVALFGRLASGDGA